MKKQKIYLQVIAALVVLFAFNCIFSATAYASDISSLWVDDATRWTYFFTTGDTPHMGTKYTTYTYASSAVKAKYSTYITNGITMWESHISCTENSSSAMGVIQVSAVNNSDAEANAATAIAYSPSTMHIGVNDDLQSRI